MPVPVHETAHRQPSYLLVWGDGASAVLSAWLGVARGAFAVTVAVWPGNMNGYVAARRTCAFLGVPFIPIPTRADVDAVVRSCTWDCIEVVAPNPVLDDSLRGGGALTVLSTDNPGLWPAALASFDLILCGSASVAEALAQACPGLAGVRTGPFGPGLSDCARRLATIRGALAERAGRSRKARGRPTLVQVVPRHGGGTAGTDEDGERLIGNLCRAVHAIDPDVACRVLASDWTVGTGTEGAMPPAGSPVTPDSFDPAATDAALAGADVVHVHQCLTRFGLFVAARARMLGCRVIGTDNGGGRAPFLASQPHLARLFHVLQTHSAYGDLAALNLPVRTVRLRGPVDDTAFQLAPDAARDPSLVVVLGHVVPHEGVEAVVDALPPSLRLVVAGPHSDPDYASFLADRARKRAVTFVPDLDDIALRNLMGRAGLCVQASTATDHLGRTRPMTHLLGLTTLEGMCTGMPAIVTRAGGLGELGGLPGCYVAGGTGRPGSGDDLRTLLRRHAEGTLPHPAGRTIRAGAVEAYGLRQFGRQYLDLVETLVACGS